MPNVRVYVALHLRRDGSGATPFAVPGSPKGSHTALQYAHVPLAPVAPDIMPLATALYHNSVSVADSNESTLKAKATALVQSLTSPTGWSVKDAPSIEAKSVFDPTSNTCDLPDAGSNFIAYAWELQHNGADRPLFLNHLRSADGFTAVGKAIPVITLQVLS